MGDDDIVIQTVTVPSGGYIDPSWDGKGEAPYQPVTVKIMTKAEFAKLYPRHE